MPGGPDGTREQGATHGVVERPGLGKRGLSVAAVLVVVAGVFLAARTADRSPDRERPTGTAPTSTKAPTRQPATSTTSATEPRDTRDAGDAGDRETAAADPVTAAELPCAVVASHPTGPPAYPFSAPTPEPEALIPGSDSHLSWIDPDLDVRVVPDSDVVILTSAGGAKEHRVVGRIDPSTGGWSESFTQDGCTLRDAVVDDSQPAAHLWLLLDADGDRSRTFVADVSLDEGTVRWSATADRATTVVPADAAVWLVTDPLAPRTADGPWSGHTALVAIDRHTHVVREPVLHVGALVTGSGELGIARDGLVTRLDPTTGGPTEDAAPIADRRLGDPGGRPVAGELLLLDAGVVAVEAGGTRLGLHDFGADALEDETTLWASSCDGGVVGPDRDRRVREAVGAIAFVTSCDTEVRVHALDPGDGEHAPDLRFEVEERPYDWPVIQPPDLTWDDTGFWYVEQAPTPRSIRDGRTVADDAWHLFHVTVDRVNPR